MFRRILIYALGAVFLTAGGVRAQQPEVEARIAGLEGNAEYMSLLREDAQLQIREDSIVNAVERMRRQLREDPGKRQQYSQEILQLESRIFEIRNAKGRLIDRINTIEQEWVLASLNGAAQQPAASAEKSPAEAVPDSLKVRNLVDNLYFREHLPAEDYAALRDAQRQEDAGRGLCQSLFRQPWHADELAETYARRADRGRGDGGFRALQRLAGREPRAGRLARCDVELDFRQQELRLRLSARQDGRGGGARPRGGGAFGGFAPAVGLAGRDGFGRRGGLFPAQTGRRRLRGRRGRSAGAGRRTRFAARRCGAARIHRLPPAEGRSRRALLPRLRQRGLLVEAGVLLPESHSRVPGLCQRHDLPHPARNVQHQARRRDFPGRLSALLPDQRRGQVVLLCGGFATLAEAEAAQAR